MTTIKDQIQKLLQQRDEAYEAYAEKTERIFYNKWIETDKLFEGAWVSRHDFYLSDVLVGMSLSDALCLGKAMNWSPAELADQLAELHNLVS